MFYDLTVIFAMIYYIFIPVLCYSNSLKITIYGKFQVRAWYIHCFMKTKKGRRSSYIIASFIQTITIYSNKSAHWVIIQGNLWNSGKTGIYKGSVVVYGF